ncbi:MAG TPA: DUF6744 family protein [Ktedonobacteraceae bacterium]|jgi:hypothetical protein
MGTPSPSTRDIRELAPALALLGYTVFWRLSGVWIRHEVLARVLAEMGFADAMPAPPAPVVALRRALLIFARHSGRTDALLLRAVGRAPGVLALVEEAPGQQGSLLYRTHLRARYDADTQEVFCTTQACGPIDATTEEPALSAPVRSLFAQACRTYLGADLSRLLRALVLACQAVRLQRGIYFVPVGQCEPLQRLDALVDQFCGAPLFATLAQVDERRTRAQLVHAIHADLVRELETIEARLRQLQETGKQPEMSTLCQHLVRVHAVQQKARSYTELLGARVQEIQARLETLHADVQHLVLLDVDDLLP